MKFSIGDEIEPIHKKYTGSIIDITNKQYAIVWSDWGVNKGIYSQSHIEENYDLTYRCKKEKQFNEELQEILDETTTLSK